MSSKCGCQFKAIRIIDESRSYSCKDLIRLETANEIWEGSNWKTYNNSLRINPYVSLHEAYRKDSSSLFLPQNIPSIQRNRILQAIQEYSNAIPKSSLAFVTSGSTGAPKVVIHKKETLVDSAQKIIDRFSKIKDMRFHNLFPGNFMAGILNNGVLPWLAQSEVYLDAVFDFKSPFDLADKSNRLGTQFAWLSPNMISSLNSAMKSNLKRVPNWDFVLSATGPLSQQKGREFRNFGIELQNTYGSTELLFLSGTTENGDSLSCGIPFDGVSIEIRNTNNLLKPSCGEVWVNSDTSPALELIFDPIENRYSALEMKSGEFRNTQDIGYFNENNLHLVSRSDDIVVLGGVNISLAAFENLADQYPGIIGSCASAPYGGSFSDLTIYFETGTDSEFDQEAFQNYVLNKFGVDESPRKFIKMKLPRTHHGKIDKAKLRGSNK